MAVRKRIAKACGVKEQAVRHWANGTRGIHSKYFRSIVDVCEDKVTVDDLISEPEAA